MTHEPGGSVALGCVGVVGLGDGAEEEMAFWRVSGVVGVIGVGLELCVAPTASALFLVELGADRLGRIEIELVNCIGVLLLL